jgi:hypothetical protein
LARHEPDIRAAGDGPLSLQDLLKLLGDAKADGKSERHEAIACYLSAGDGWDEAVRRLGGTFAAEDTGLKDRKAD